MNDQPVGNIPFDPDFDEETSEVREVASAAGVPPAQAFVAGVIAAVLVLGTIGFITLLAVVLTRSPAPL